MLDNYTPTWMSEELRSLESMTKRFIAEEITPNQEKWCDAGATDKEVWLKAGELGILCPDISSEYGGSGGDFSYEAVVARQLCIAGDTSWRVGKQIHVIAAHYIEKYGTEEQKRRYLPGLCKGELIAGMGMSEPGGGTDLKNLRTKAELLETGGYRINGSKTFITNGSIADILVLAVRTSVSSKKADGISLFIFETKTPGFHVGQRLKKVGLHGSDTCELFFQDCDVPASSLLGEVEGQGFYQMMKDLPYERALVGVNCAAVMEHAYELTAAYAKEREIFDGKLIDLQHTRFELAEIKTVATISRIFTDFTVSQYLAGGLTNELSSMSKYWISERQFETVTRCLQLFGGHGYIMEYPIAKMFVDSRIETIYGGANEILKDLIGRTI